MTLGIGAGAVVVGGLLYLAFTPVDVSEVLAEARQEKQRAGKMAAGKEDCPRPYRIQSQFCVAVEKIALKISE